MSKFLAGLNPEQQKAVTIIRGPVLVLAGAGTGKTNVITHRIAYMIAGGIPSSSIPAMTFTNKAAGEMRERIAGLVPREKAEGLTVGTFHSFCVRALRQFHEKAGVRKNFGICDEDDQIVAMKQAMHLCPTPACGGGRKVMDSGRGAACGGQAGVRSAPRTGRLAMRLAWL